MLPPGLDAELGDILEQPEQERHAALESLCAAHPDHATAIRRRVQRADAILLELDAGFLADQLPEQIGPYRVLRRLGEGGMGVVYLGEQQQPVRRQVALKVVKAGLDTRRVLQRFAREREALARMNHSGIAKVFETGITPQGQPWFAMEFIEGLPITAHCDQQQLDLRARIRLFLAVCAAVQHAHHRGVLHRDLKPSNVLVAAEEGSPCPKVIDFGLAKALQEPLGDEGLRTLEGCAVGTPEYMAPEQAAAGGEDVDLRADVWSLGVLLHELLAGSLPHDPQTLRRSGTLELARLLRDAAPRRASRAALAAGDAAARLRGQRDAQALSRALRRELDWIVLRALAPERARRYQSAGELAADLERYLADEPITARPPTALYRATKFARRHPAGTAAVAATIGAGAIGFVAVLLALFEAQAARRDAETQATAARAVTGFLLDLFRSAGPTVRDGEDLPVSALFEIGARRLEGELQDQPQIRARLLATLARTQNWLGQGVPAERSIEQALHAAATAAVDPLEELDWRLLRATIAMGDGRHDLAGNEAQRIGEQARQLGAPAELLGLRAQSMQARALLVQGRVDEARGLYGQLATRIDACSDPLIRAGLLVDQAGFHHDVDEFTRADELFASAVSTLRQLGARGRLELVTALRGQARNLAHRAEHARARAAIDEALVLMERAIGPDSPGLAAILVDVAAVAQLANHHAAAEAALRRSIELRRAAFGPHSPSLAWSLNDLGAYLNRTGRSAEAAAVLAEAVAIWRAAYPGGHPHLATGLANLAEARSRGPDVAAAVADARAAIAMLDALPQASGYSRALARRTLAEVLARSGDPAGADAALSESLATEVRGDRSAVAELRALALGLRAFLANQRQQHAAAADAAVQALAEFAQAPQASRLMLGLTHYNAGWAAAGLGREDAAIAAMQTGIEVLRDAFPDGHPEAAYPCSHLGQLLLRRGDPAAIPLLRAAVRMRRPADGPVPSPFLLANLVNLGRAELEHGDPAAAELALDEALQGFAAAGQAGSAGAEVAAGLRERALQKKK